MNPNRNRRYFIRRPCTEQQTITELAAMKFAGNVDETRNDCFGSVAACRDSP
jgi:hypothetical protein